MSQKNSFIKLMENISQLNKNSIEVLAKLSDVVSTTKDNVSIDFLESDDTFSSYQMPTIGWLKKEIDIANSNIKKLSTLEGDNSTIIIGDDNISKKIKSIDLNREPKQISNLNVITDFQEKNNWFFESLINPLLTVEINLGDQISENVNKVLSRRYILKFEKDEDGNLTTNGQASLEQFESQFLNRNDFSIDDFLNWLNNPFNLGVINKDNVNKHKDEQIFDLNYKEINYKGYFTVLKLERDDLNNKLWYHLNTLSYYDREGNSNILATGDILTINSESYTKYRVIEVNTSSDLFRINVERIEGYDPIPIGNNVLEYYSPLERQNDVKVSIGFDEYNVIFLKSINTDNNIISSEWSKGTAFYTNDLNLFNDDNVNMTDFYVNNVYDYGMILKDLVSKMIPSPKGVKPNVPELVLDNFKVTQINKHLTDTNDFQTLKKLHSQKNSIKSKISEVEDAIVQKNAELNTKTFRSLAEKSKSQNELDKLIKQQESDTKLYSSYVNQITNSVVEVKSDPKFRLRGFWDFPSPILKKGEKPQEVIGFEVQYRYSSKTGAENTTEGFEFKRPINDQITRKKTAYFSKWIPYETSIRKRIYDKNKNVWVWETEDVGDADKPNVNQIDIPISPGEKIEIRIRSISEVGYPDSIIYSDWSEIITKEFPDELNQVLGENKFILNESIRDQAKVSFENDLRAKGIPTHVRESYYNNDQYVAHTDRTIATSFKDQFGNTLMLFDYIKQLNDRINSLEEIVKRAKGELKVTLFENTNDINIKNGSIIYIDVECQDYMIADSSTILTNTFQNNIYLITDYSLKLENIANENDLGLLSYRLENFVFDGVDDERLPTYYNSDGEIYKQSDNQYVWFMESATIDGVDEDLYLGVNDPDDLADNVLSQDFLNVSYFSGDTLDELLTPSYWSGSTESIGSTIHPFIKRFEGNTNELVNTDNDFIKIIKPQEDIDIPLYIFFKPDLSAGETVEITKSDTPQKITKAIRVNIEKENSFRPFEFTLVFRLHRHKQYSQATTGVTQIEII